MTDLEITKLCAAASGIKPFRAKFQPHDQVWAHDPEYPLAPTFRYDPLRNDAQAMALVKRFGLLIESDGQPPKKWTVSAWDALGICWQTHECDDLNRAICEAVVRAQAAKAAASE